MSFRSSFGLPRVFQELFRIRLPVVNLDMHNSHYVSILDLLDAWDVDAADLFPTVHKVATRRDVFIDGLRQAFPQHSANDFKKQLIAIAYQCALNVGWPKALQDLHSEVARIIELHAKKCPNDIKVFKVGLWV